eukprot:scaffold26185_cov62-Phaeocystis_antarctica.AAC.6
MGAADHGTYAGTGNPLVHAPTVILAQLSVAELSVVGGQRVRAAEEERRAGTIVVRGVCVELRPRTVVLIDVIVKIRVSAATDFARAVILGKERLVVERKAVCATARCHRRWDGGGPRGSRKVGKFWRGYTR